MSLLVAGSPLAIAATGLLLHGRRERHRQRELVLRACHELRGPLTNALLALDRPPTDGSRGAGGAGGTEAVLPVVRSELARARREIEELSAAAIGRRRRDERRPVDLDALVREVVAVQDASARGRGRRVVVGGPPSGTTVVGDRARLAQAIGNLTQNALEHGVGTVRVAVQRGTGTVEVLVADEGHGLVVPVERLLRRPLRGQRGRGLRIVADALAVHGGRLRSLPSGDGTRLVAELPVAGSVVRVVAR